MISLLNICSVCILIKPDPLFLSEALGPSGFSTKRVGGGRRRRSLRGAAGRGEGRAQLGVMGRNTGVRAQSAQGEASIAGARPTAQSAVSHAPLRATKSAKPPCEKSATSAREGSSKKGGEQEDDTGKDGEEGREEEEAVVGGVRGGTGVKSSPRPPLGRTEGDNGARDERGEGGKCKRASEEDK